MVEGEPRPQGALLSRPADVNECETGVHRCGEGQVCHNLPGSYRCDCKAGFQRDAFGRSCIGRWCWGLGFPLSVGPAPLCPSTFLPLAAPFPSGAVPPAWVSPGGQPTICPSSSWLQPCTRTLPAVLSHCLCSLPLSASVPVTFLPLAVSVCLSVPCPYLLPSSSTLMPAAIRSLYLPLPLSGSLPPNPTSALVVPRVGGREPALWPPPCAYCPAFPDRRERVLGLARPPVPAHV